MQREGSSSYIFGFPGMFGKIKTQVIDKWKGIVDSALQFQQQGLKHTGLHKFTVLRNSLSNMLNRGFFTDDYRVFVGRMFKISRK